MSIKEKMAQALAKRDVMEMPWETLTPAAQWVYLCDVDAMLVALSTAGYAIVSREVTPEITRVYLNIQGPSDSGVSIEQHWRTLIAEAEAHK